MVSDGGSDLVVIGGGPGGYPAAFLAADMGMKVTLIDDAPNPGGVCLYRGCIPSKALLHVAAQLEEAKHAEEWGVSYGDPSIDLDKLRQWKQGVVNRLTGGLGQLTKQHGVEFVSGRARFNGPRSVEVNTSEGEQRSIGFEYAIVATGSLPATIPSLALDSRWCWTPPRRWSLRASRKRCSSSAAGTSGSNWAASTLRSARASPSSR